MADLETRLEASITKLVTDSDKLHEIVHGEATETVSTDNGDIKTAAGAIAGIADRLDEEISGAGGRVDTAIEAITAKGDTAIEAVTAKGDTAIVDITDRGDDEIADVDTKGTAIVRDITVRGNNTINDITTRGNATITDITTRGDAAIDMIVSSDDQALRDLSNVTDNALDNAGLKGYRKTGAHEVLANNTDLDGLSGNSTYAFVGDNVVNAPPDIGAGIVITFYNDVLKIIGVQVIHKIVSENTGNPDPKQFSRGKTDTGWGPWIEGASGASGSDRIAVKSFPFQGYGFVGDTGCGFIMADGTIRMWGKNLDYALGMGESLPGQLTAKKPIQPVFQGIRSPIKKWIRVWRSSMVLLEDGSLYVWGKNNKGQLGTGDRKDVGGPTLVSERINTDSKIVDIAMGNTITSGADNHAFVLTENGQLWGVGDNTDGQLGLSNSESTVEKLYKLIPGTWSAIYAFGSQYGYSYAVSSVAGSVGRLYACGYNVNGQLGYGVGDHAISNSTFTEVGPAGETIVEVVSNGARTADIIPGKEHTIIKTASGKIYRAGGDSVSGLDSAEVFTEITDDIGGGGDITKILVSGEIVAMIRNGQLRIIGNKVVGVTKNTWNDADASRLRAILDIVSTVADGGTQKSEFLSVLAFGGEVFTYRFNSWDRLYGTNRKQIVKITTATFWDDGDGDNFHGESLGAITEDGYYYQLGGGQPDGGNYASLQLIRV